MMEAIGSSIENQADGNQHSENVNRMKPTSTKIACTESTDPQFSKACSVLYWQTRCATPNDHNIWRTSGRLCLKTLKNLGLGVGR